MKKKISFGGIIAVVLISLTSITPVISFQTDNTYSTVVSPLYNIRTERAINRANQDALLSNYIGKGKIVKIPFTFQTRVLIIGNIIQRIKQIDNGIFYKLLTYLLQENHDSDEIPAEIVEMLTIVNEVTDVESDQEHEKLSTVLCQTLKCHTIDCNTVLAGCLTYRIFTGLIRMLDKLYPYTTTNPLFKGAMIELLYQVIIKIYMDFDTIHDCGL